MEMNPEVYENTCKTCKSLQNCIENGISCSIVGDYINHLKSLDDYECFRVTEFSILPDKMLINKNPKGDIQLSFFKDNSWICDSYIKKSGE